MLGGGRVVRAGTAGLGYGRLKTSVISIVKDISASPTQDPAFMKIRSCDVFVCSFDVTMVAKYPVLTKVN